MKDMLITEIGRNLVKGTVNAKTDPEAEIDDCRGFPSHSSSLSSMKKAKHQEKLRIRTVTQQDFLSWLVLANSIVNVNYLAMNMERDSTLAVIHEHYAKRLLQKIFHRERLPWLLCAMMFT
jgi:hypothetical protein